MIALQAIIVNCEEFKKNAQLELLSYENTSDSRRVAYTAHYTAESTKQKQVVAEKVDFVSIRFSLAIADCNAMPLCLLNEMHILVHKVK